MFWKSGKQQAFHVAEMGNVIPITYGATLHTIGGRRFVDNGVCLSLLCGRLREMRKPVEIRRGRATVFDQ